VVIALKQTLFKFLTIIIIVYLYCSMNAGFSTFFSIVSIKTLFQKCISVKNSSDKFPRWRRNSGCCLFSLYSAYKCIYVRFFLKIFIILQHCLIEIFFAKIVINSLGGATITHAGYTVFWTNFCAFRCFFKNVPTQNPMFLTRSH